MQFAASPSSKFRAPRAPDICVALALNCKEGSISFSLCTGGVSKLCLAKTYFLGAICGPVQLKVSTQEG